MAVALTGVMHGRLGKHGKPFPETPGDINNEKRLCARKAFLKGFGKLEVLLEFPHPADIMWLL